SSSSTTMGDENHIRTLGDYSKPSNEGYRNTIELPVRNNVNQVQSLMEAHLAPTQPTQVNKVTTSCEICNGPHDTKYFMEDPEQAFVEYATSRTDEAGGQKEDNNIGNTNFSPQPQPGPLASIATEQVPKLNSMLKSLRLVPQSSNKKFVCSKKDDIKVMFIEIIRDYDEPQNEDPNDGEWATTEGSVVECFDTFPTRDELTYHKLYLMRRSLEVLRNFHWTILGCRFSQLSQETATYGKIWDNEDVHDLGSIKTNFPAIIFNDMLTSDVTLSCEPMVSSLNDNQIDFRISFDESDDEDCTVIFDKNSFSYKVIPVNDLKMDLENDNDKVDMPSFLSPESTVSYFNDLDYFKDFDKEFPAIVYNDALTSKFDFLTEPTGSP
nr:hypothetical protein [Tanacetum cinerariifolium]